MKGLLAFCLVSLVFTATSAQKGAKKPIVCTAMNIVSQKCNPAKAGGWCIPRVTGVTYDQYNVKPTSFLVTWKGVAAAKCYFVEVFTGHTTFLLRRYSCVKGTQFTVNGLRPWKVYGVRVSAVNRRCKRGQPSNPIVRIKTYWSPEVVVTKPTARPTYSPKVGACGKNFYTCASNKKECIPKKKYCNRVLDCADGTDERGCPGGCKEIDVEFKNGNYSCSRWGSPGSFCFFDCDDGYSRDGSRFTQCSRRAKVWTHPIPTCRRG